MMGETCHVARSADGAAPAKPRPSAYALRAPAASAISETVRDGWRPLPGRAPPRRHPHPGTTSRGYPSRGPGQPFRPCSPTATKAPGPPRAPSRRPHCASSPGFDPRPRLTPPPPHLGTPGPLGVGVRCRPRAATARGWHRHRPRVGWVPTRPLPTAGPGTNGPGWNAATGPRPPPPGQPRMLSVNPGAVAPPPLATEHPLIGSNPGKWVSHGPGPPTSCPLRPHGAGQRAAPRPGAAHPGARGGPLRPHAGTSLAYTSIPRREDDEPRWSACGLDARAGSSTHPPRYRRRQPGLPFHPQRGPRRPMPAVPRGLPLVARPAPG